MIDRAYLRRTLVTGWKPRQSVQIEVGVLAALLDECDRLGAELRAGDAHAKLEDQLQPLEAKET